MPCNKNPAPEACAVEERGVQEKNTDKPFQKLFLCT